MNTVQKSNWHGPKQTGIMAYCGLLMLIGACIVGGSTNTILPAISAIYGWDVNFLRMMAGVGCMAVVLGNLVFGTLTVRKGPKFSIALSLVLTAVFTVIYGMTSSFPLFIATILILGFLSGGYKEVGCNALVNNWWPTKKGIVLGWVTMGIVLVDVVWQPFIPRAFAAIGVGPTMCAVAAVILLVTVIGLVATKNIPEEAGELPDGDGTNPENSKAVIAEMRTYRSPFTFGVMLRHRSTWAIGIGMGLLFMVGMSYVASIVPRLLSCGYDYHWATIVLVVGGIVGLCGSWLFGFVDQKLGTRRASLCYGVVCVLAMAIALLHAKSQAAVWISTIVFFAAQGGCCNLIPSFVGTKFGRWDYASAYRVIGAITALFAGIGVLCTGAFPSYNVMYIFNICAAVVAIVIIFKTNDSFIGKPG